MTEQTQGAAQAEPKVKIRKLNTGDFWKLLKIIQKGGKDAFAQLNQAGEDQAAMILLDVGMQYAETELQGFLAGIANMSLEEYRAGDFDLTLSILEQWQEQENLSDFFKRAANFIKKFSFKN